MAKQGVLSARGIVRVVAGLALLGSTQISIPRAEAATPLTMSGIVRDGANPVANVCVEAVGGPTDETAADGVYSLTFPNPQNVAVRVNDCSPARHNALTAFAPQAFTVTLPQAGLDRDVALVRGAFVTGTVTAADDDAPLGCDIGVVVPGFATEFVGRSDESDGSYAVGPFDAAADALFAVRSSCVKLVSGAPQAVDYVGEFWQDAYHPKDAVGIPVDPGEIVEDLDVELEKGGTVTGTVTGANGSPMTCVSVYANVTGHNGLTSATRGLASSRSLSGSYVLKNVPPVPIALEFEDCDLAAPAHVSEYWDNEAFAIQANPLLVAPGTTRGSRNAQLGTAAPTRSNCTVQPFSDVVPATPFCEEIAWMHELGISAGTPNGANKPLYKPDDGVSRQAMAAFLHRFFGDEPPEATTPFFADVAPSHQFYDDIQWMAENEISTGTPQASGKPLYKPSDLVSRQAMAAFIFRAADLRDGSAPPVQACAAHFADVSSSSQFFTAIQWMRQSGISTGTAQAPPNKPLFKPIDPVSRLAMAAFKFRFWNYQSFGAPACPAAQASAVFDLPRTG